MSGRYAPRVPPGLCTREFSDAAAAVTWAWWHASSGTLLLPLVCALPLLLLVVVVYRATARGAKGAA